MKNTRIFKILIITITLLIGISILKVNYSLNNGETIKVTNSLISKQNIIDKNINSAGFTIDNPKIILDPYDISPLTALIVFESSESVAPKVTVKSNGKSEDLKHSFKKAEIHYLPIYGLYPNFDNQVIISINNQDYNFSIKTNPLPKELANLKKEVFVDESKISLLNQDFYFMTPASDGYTCAYDVDGNIRWYLSEKLVWDIDRLANGNLLLSNERLINPPYYTTGLYEISPLGKIYKEYVLPGGYHHDVFELENTNLIIASNDFDGQTVEDYIVEIDSNTGDIVKKIDLKDILDVNASKSENWIDYDWFHNNSVFYDKDSNSLILSGRHQDSIVSLDYDSLEINYILGDPNGVSDDYKKHFLSPINDVMWPYAQHSAIILSNNDLFVFDNGNNRSKNKEDYIAAKDNYSRGVIFNIDQENMEVSQVYEYGKDRGSDYYSSYISNVKYLNKDHYLIHSGGVAYKDGDVLNEPPGISKADTLKSYTTEVLNNEKIFELSLNNNNYRANKLAIYSENEEFIKVDGLKLGSLSETEPDLEGYKVIRAKNSNDSELEKFKLKIDKEDDRLVVSGDFKATDNVSVILYNNFKVKEYNINLSSRPYTAMCIDIFNDKENVRVDKYINDMNLFGKHSILIKINEKIYHTNKLVDYN